MFAHSQVYGEHLSSMLLGDGERWLAVVTSDAYLDEAGTDAASSLVTVAGFYGNKEQWLVFRELWKPHSSGFHAKSCDERFPNLCDAIEKSEIDGIFITLEKRTYKAMATEHMKSRLGNPYALCAFQCVLTICTEVKAPTAFVLEHGQPNLPFVRSLLEYMMDSGQFCIAAVTGARKGDFIELHPADFVSHCASSHDTKWLQRLFDSHRLTHGHIGEKQLDGIGPELTALIKRAQRERLKAKKAR
jgi:hypothetical protein